VYDDDIWQGVEVFGRVAFSPWLFGISYKAKFVDDGAISHDDY